MSLQLSINLHDRDPRCYLQGKLSLWKQTLPSRALWGNGRLLRAANEIICIRANRHRLMSITAALSLRRETIFCGPTLTAARQSSFSLCCVSEAYANQGAECEMIIVCALSSSLCERCWRSDLRLAYTRRQRRRRADCPRHAICVFQWHAANEQRSSRRKEIESQNCRWWAWESATEPACSACVVPRWWRYSIDVFLTRGAHRWLDGHKGWHLMRLDNLLSGDFLSCYFFLLRWCIKWLWGQGTFSCQL